MGITARRGKQTGAWALGQEPFIRLTVVRGGIGGGVGCYVVCGWCMGDVMSWLGDDFGCYVV
jgi:hypothetical protein